MYHTHDRRPRTPVLNTGCHVVSELLCLMYSTRKFYPPRSVLARKRKPQVELVQKSYWAWTSRLLLRLCLRVRQYTISGFTRSVSRFISVYVELSTRRVRNPG